MKRPNPEKIELDDWDDWDDIADSKIRKKNIQKQRKKETNEHGFGCNHCRNWVPIHEEMGTHNRNHCPTCLWSAHVDDETPGDRKSLCKQGMKPVALTFKGESKDKYASSSEQQLGELMLVHECVMGDQIRINRIAADDSPYTLLEVFHAGHDLPVDTQDALLAENIQIASNELSGIVMKQLFGPDGYHVS